MKTRLNLAVFILLTGVLFYISCKKEYSCEGCRDGNKPPIAVAGPDRVITLPTDSVLLDGSSSSDPDGMISSYLWTKISGPATFNILKPSDSITKVKAFVEGSYLFELKVTDNGGLSAKDTIRIIVDLVLTTNHPPIANAGADQTIILPTNVVNLDANGSTDPENNITNYVWTKISGPSSINIINSNAVQTQVTTLVQGIYQFELKVTDALGLFSKDTMQVIVNAAVSNNLPPVAIAGNDTTIQTNQTSCTPVPITITINGNNSYDPDGNISSYLWIGPNVITNPNSAVTTVTGLVPNTYWFILKVTDNSGAFTSDTLHISIVPANRPLIPAQLIPIGTLSQTRGGVAVAAAGNKLVFAGGSIGNAPGSTRADIYDINTGTWAISELSAPRFNIGTATLGNKVFFAGGIFMRQGSGGVYYSNNSCDTRSSVIDIFDVSANTWSTAQLSHPRRTIGTSAGNKVVFAGGEDPFVSFCGNSERVDIYDEGTNSWSTASLSVGRIPGQPAIIGNKIYFGGGGDPGDNYIDHVGMYQPIDIYDASSNTWSVDLLSTARSQMGCVSINNKIYWGGGIIPDVLNGYYEVTNSVEIRDLATNTTSFDCLSEPKFGLTAVRKNNKIIFFGGYNLGSVIDGYPLKRFDIYDLTTNSWSIGVLPQNLLNPSIISYNNILYVAGGSINGVWANQVYKLEF